MSDVSNGAAPIGPECERTAALALAYFAGEADLGGLDALLEHVPGCGRCKAMLDSIGREVGAIRQSWEEQLAVYDPVGLLEGSAGPDEAAGPAPELRVMRGQDWLHATVAASARLAHQTSIPLFRGAGALPFWTGAAGGFRVTLAAPAAGGFQVRVTDPGGDPLPGARVRFESRGLLLFEALLDASGSAELQETLETSFDTMLVLAPE